MQMLVYDLFHAKVKEITNLLDREPDDFSDDPVWLWDTGGRFARLHAIWLLPDDTDQVWNHGFHVDQFSSKEIRMMAWGRGHQARLELYGDETTVVDNVSAMLTSILPNQLRTKPETPAEPPAELPPIRQRPGGKPHSDGPIIEL